MVQTDEIVVPNCPDCGSNMTLRTARRGQNAGGRFWGCTTYPKCRGTRPQETAPTTEPGADEATVSPGRSDEPRLWIDRTLQRPGWSCRYSNAGAALRSVPNPNPATGACWIAVRSLPEVDIAGPQIVGHLLRKLIQRGTRPPIHPDAEGQLLILTGLLDHAQPTRIPGDLALEIPRALQPRPGAGTPPTVPLEDEREIEFDSDEEGLFFDWMRANTPGLAPWIIPQAPLDTLAGTDVGSTRRIDFLLSAPEMPTIAIEIDGSQHDESRTDDGERDKILRDLGYDVHRIPVSELRLGSGSALESLRRKLLLAPAGADVDYLQLGPQQLHRFALALGDLVNLGALRGDALRIEVTDDLNLGIDAYLPYLDLLAALACLWDPAAISDAIDLEVNGVARSLVRNGAVYEEAPSTRPQCDRSVRVRLECLRTPMHALVASSPGPEVVVRSAHIPVRVDDPMFEGIARPRLAAGAEETHAALRGILRAIFAKGEFREGQAEAITELIAGRDCAVLLPTGAGKSLIYQLAGLALPGRTVVIDPLIALMEDQIAGLAAIGVDRVASFSQFQTRMGFAGASLQKTASGEALFIFVAPERFQRPSFRDSIRQLAQTTPINLAVVDEAHCVSEWGHDFRTAYLKFGDVLRNVCRDVTGQPPPIVALTGTASRAVLRDTLLELGIERAGENSVIRPATLDRSELRFDVVRCEPQEALAALVGMVRTMPTRLGIPYTDAFRDRGADTTSGIVFVPHVNGDYGVREVAEALSSALGVRVAMYAGSAPRGFAPDQWEHLKRQNAADFMENRVPLLVSTKAFGMGIDKSNVRYVVHFGIPSSIEAYYQEAGRAGRDRSTAQCGLLLVEYDEARADRLLQERGDLEGMRDAVARMPRSAADDITRQLFFHLNAFGGIDQELTTLGQVLEELGDLAERHRVEVPFRNDEDGRERALHRLAVLGAVRDYVIEGQRFLVDVQATTAADVVNSLIAYIRRYNRSLAASHEEATAELRTQSPKDAILAAGQRLIAFVYETVERSRRRSLREMWLAARQSGADGDRVLRERVLSYLTEGELAPRLEALLDRDRFAFPDWIAALGAIEGDDEVGELRGTTARLLGSYPDHPGLLYARAWSEALDPRGDLNELVTNLRASLESARDKYQASEHEIQELVDTVLREARSLSPAVETALVAAAIEASIESDEASRLLATAFDRPSADPGMRVLAFTKRLRLALQALERTT